MAPSRLRPAHRLDGRRSASCIDMFIRGNVGNGATGKPVSTGRLFDGFNIDWEYPAATDRRNFTPLIEEFRPQLNMLERTCHCHYWLTIDSPTQQKDYADVELAQAARQLDFLTLDGYDFAQGGAPPIMHRRCTIPSESYRTRAALSKSETPSTTLAFLEPFAVVA